MKSKLIKVERTINAYNKQNELLWEIDIDIPIDKLIQIIIPNEDNNLELYDGYELSLDQLQKINSLPLFGLFHRAIRTRCSDCSIGQSEPLIK